MKKYQFLFFLIVLAMCNTHLYPQTIDERNQFRNEVESDLTGNILPFWMEHMIDPDGGFYGSANVEGNPNNIIS